jgi:putative colanic acid biosynthesis glycosyltransferase
MSASLDTQAAVAPAGTARTHGGRRVHAAAGMARQEDRLVTVVTVAYNCASSIEATILSVIQQSHPGIEYIVIDGGSTDSTVQIIRKYEQQIDYWVSEKDSGIYNAMNKGIALSTGRWINFMNAGDCFHSSRTVENMSGVLDERFAVVAGAVQYVYDPDHRRTRHMHPKFSGFYLEVPHHQASFINNAVMKSLKYDESFRIRADLNFMALLHAKGHQFRMVDEVVCDVDTTGVSSGLSKRHISEDIRAGSLVIEHYWLKSILYHAFYVFPRLMLRKLLPKQLEARIRSSITN